MKGSRAVQMTLAFFTRTLSWWLSTLTIWASLSNQRDLDELFANLDAKGFSFTKEGTFTDFLGINFVKDPKNGTLTLTQKGLIQKIQEATGMKMSNSNWTPAGQAALGIDPMVLRCRSLGAIALWLGCSFTFRRTLAPISRSQSVRLLDSLTTRRRVTPPQLRRSFVISKGRTTRA
ncbi:hypothetical protein MHU86_6169 [Fragilaria crotonensis]|nr:hypothetical protein MHU86_6169 [Fragilaria crotonensis]